jgi:aspartate/tyrosine/aromatic aminotransferase
MTMFADLAPRPPDAILGLMERFRSDPREHKVSLAQGVYVDESGTTPLLESVRAAEERLLRTGASKVYKPIDGDPAYRSLVRDLVFETVPEVVAEGRVELLHTPGGTGALRVAADLLASVSPGASVWLSDPTWPNHPQVFGAAGLAVRSYPYLDSRTGGLDLDGLLGRLREATPGDVVVLHGCCHNPTGVDPDESQWRAIADAVRERGLLPLLDFAYQGFGDGLREDARGLTALVRSGREVLVASSFSKNFALYDERVGALSIVAADRHEGAVLLTHAKAAVRASYSNPPAHGGEVVATILADQELRATWEEELRAMRERINGNRARFVDGLHAAGFTAASGALLRQRGMFSLLGLHDAQVQRLRDEFAVYVVGGGRVNVAGLTANNLGPVCAALAAVTADRAEAA